MASFKMISRKSACIRFVSVVIIRPYLGKFFFFYLLNWFFHSEPGGLRRISSLSSLERPLLLIQMSDENLRRRKRPTSSQISAPLHDPMVTSKVASAFFSHTAFLLKSNYFLQCQTIDFVSSLTWVNCDAKWKAFLRRLSEIDG